MYVLLEGFGIKGLLIPVDFGTVLRKVGGKGKEIRQTNLMSNSNKGIPNLILSFLICNRICLSKVC